jgi:protein-disulfide isomerase
MNVFPPDLQQPRSRRERRMYITSAAVSAATAALIVGLVFGGLAFHDALTEDSQPAAQAAQAPAGGETAEATPTEPPEFVANVSVDDDPFQGPENAPVTIVEFSDFQCPYCKKAADELVPQILAQYGDKVRFVYRDFPLTQLHPRALPAALAADCANAQGKFWQYHDLLFANQSALDDASLEAYAAQLGLDQATFDECYTSREYFDEVAADFQDGVDYGVSGTPTFFVNGHRLVGAQPFAAVQQVIEQVLAGGG